MKDFYTHLNKKTYYTIVLIMMALMILGLVIGNPYLGEMNNGYFLHSILVILLSVCLLQYPRYKNRFLRIAILIVGSAYFYTIFFLYPNTSSTIIFLYFIPAISILFFDSKLFYYSLFGNGLLVAATFGYIMLADPHNLYFHLKEDLIANIFNFIGSQVMIYFIYHLSYERIKKQQLYYEQLQHTERLKTTGQLSAAFAHEIRNPLTVVKGFLQLYSEKSSTFSQDVKDHFTLMINELNVAEQVISQYLTISRPDHEKRIEVINVKLILQGLTELLISYGLLRNNTIELHVEEDCYILANEIEYKQLMINIIKNAIEVSNMGDSVVITAKKRNQFVEIKVIDYGIGMSETEIESLGTPFYSLKSNGTGLGIMICYHIVEKYNGSMHFESSKGKGTTVTLRFPSTLP